MEVFWERAVDLWELSRWLRAGVFIAISVVAAYVVEVAIARTFLVLARKTETDLDDQVVETLRRPIFISVILYGLAMAADELLAPIAVDPGLISTLEEMGVKNASKISGGGYESAQFLIDGCLKTLAVLIWGAAAFKCGTAVLETISRRRQASLVQPRTVPIFDMLLRLLVVGAGVYFTFLAWDIDVTAWLASAGIVGIAVGFAAKDTLANLFSGIFILADAPYKLGDWIVLDDQLRGKVTRIGVRSTRILTRDDIEITVPNAVIGNSKIVNEAGGHHIKQRIAAAVSVSYESDVDQVNEVLIGIPEGIAGVCEYPRPEIRFRSFGGSGLEYELLVWVEDPATKGRVVHDLNCKIYKRFAAEGIEIPYSKHDVYIKQMPTPAEGSRRALG